MCAYAREIPACAYIVFERKKENFDSESLDFFFHFVDFFSVCVL